MCSVNFLRADGGCTLTGEERVYGLWMRRSCVWEGGPLPACQRKAKIIISRSGTNSLLEFAVSCSDFPGGELRKEKRIQSWSLELQSVN